MRDLDDFLTLVAPVALHAPEPLLLRCLRDTAIRFCQRTRLWRDTDTINTSGVNPETISVPPDSILLEILTCAISGVPLDPISLNDLSRVLPTWRTDDVGQGGASWYVSPEWGTVQPVPRAAGTITVEFAIKPTPDAQTLPDFLFDLYGQTLADGAAGQALLMPGQTYTNPQFGGLLSGRFQTELDCLVTAGRRGQQRGPTRTRAQFM